MKCDFACGYTVGIDSGKKGLARVFGVLVASVLGMVSIEAVAAPGDGLKTESLELHPGLEIGTVYDTNLFRRSGEAPARPADGKGVQNLHVVPALSLSNRNTGSLEFAFESRVAWEQYLSEERRIRNQSGLSAMGRFGTVFNPEGDIQFSLSEELVRSNEPPSGARDGALNRIRNTVDAGLGLRPWSGVFDLSAGYRWIIHYYESFRFRDLNKDTHRFDAEIGWNFLPETRFFALGETGIVEYRMAERSIGVEPERGGEVLENDDSRPRRLQGGLEGLLTTNLEMRLQGGYGRSRTEGESSFTGPIGRARLVYSVDPDRNRELWAEYRHDFRDATIGDYTEFDRGSGGILWEFYERRWRIDLEGGIESMYQPGIGNVIVSDREHDAVVALPRSIRDTLFDARVGLRYRPYRWWFLDASYKFDTNVTNSDAAVEAGVDADPSRNYRRHRVGLSTSIRY